MVLADALRRAPAMQEVHVLVLIPSSAHCFIYADRCKIWRKEADAISRVERIISGEGTGRLWMILAEGVIQRARAGAPGRVRGCDGRGLGLRSGCVS